MDKIDRILELVQNVFPEANGKNQNDEFILLCDDWGFWIRKDYLRDVQDPEAVAKDAVMSLASHKFYKGI